MLPPLSITRRLVVDACQEMEVFKGNLFLLNAQLVVQLAPRRILDACNGVGEVGAGFRRYAEGVRAAGIGPHVREGDLLRRTLLQKKPILVIKEEDGEGSVEKALVDVGHQMACSKGG